jgi:hypothetical protein
MLCWPEKGGSALGRRARWRVDLGAGYYWRLVTHGSPLSEVAGVDTLLSDGMPGRVSGLSSLA